MHQVSVIVCAKDEEGFIEKCLKRLKSQSIKPEIIVVDGHSTDKTVKIAKKYADKVVSDNKKGISDARNVGWKTASGDIVAYCDADALPPRDWVERISKSMYGNVAIFGPIFPYDGNKRTKIGLKVWGNWFLKATSLLKYPCICAANAAFMKNILKKYPFRLNFLEDFDLGNRLRKVGRVKFVRKMYMPISARRFARGFHRTAFRYYLLNYFRLKVKHDDMKGYWK